MRLDRVREALDAADEVLGAAFSHETRLRIRMQQRARALEQREEELKAARAELARWRRQANQLDERLRFLRSMAQAAMERGREELP
jgi:hypothetical protein